MVRFPSLPVSQPYPAPPASFPPSAPPAHPPIPAAVSWPRWTAAPWLPLPIQAVWLSALPIAPQAKVASFALAVLLPAPRQASALPDTVRTRTFLGTGGPLLGPAARSLAPAPMPPGGGPG